MVEGIHVLFIMYLGRVGGSVDNLRDSESRSSKRAMASHHSSSSSSIARASLSLKMEEDH